MVTDELILALRKMAEKFMHRNDELPFLLNQAADQLEDLDERVSIMGEGSGMTAWELFELLTSAYGGRQIFFRQKNGTVYDRCRGDYVTFNEAIERYTKLLTNNKREV